MKLPEPFYQDEQATIYCGDNRQLLPLIEPDSIDLVLTDPPYGIGQSRGKSDSRNPRVRKTYEVADWDDRPPPDWLLELALSIGDHHIVFGGNYFGLPPSSCWLVWDKNNGEKTAADCELAWTDLKKAVRRLRYTWDGFMQEHMDLREPRVHPTQKPVPVMKWCIQQVPGECGTTLDPWMGSGSTLIAARDMGCKAIGLEISEAYCQIAVNRLRQSVFDFEPASPRP